MAQLPCDNDGVCLRCKAKPPQEETLACGTCGTPWHAPCLSSPPETLASTLQWHCPDCSGEIDPLLPVSGAAGHESGCGGSDLVAAIRAIEADESLTEADKAKKRQELLSGKSAASADEDDEGKKSAGLDVDVLAALGENLNCSFCIQLPERPVTVRSLSLSLFLSLDCYLPRVLMSLYDRSRVYIFFDSFISYLGFVCLVIYHNSSSAF